MKIFVLLSRFPYPLEKGDKLRAFNQIKYLSKNNEIHLCAINDIKLKNSYIEALQPYCTSIHVIDISKFNIISNIALAFINGKPLQLGYFYNRKGQQKIKRLINEIQPDHIYCQLIRVSDYVRNQPIAKTLDYQDVFSKGVDRRSKTASFVLKPILKSEYRRLLRYEKEIFDFFDNKTIISIPDRELIPHPERDTIKIIINGVDTEYFKPQVSEKEYDLVFTGNMGYPPNVNAAEFLANEILPLVHAKKPGVKLTLAGASPHQKVLALKGEHVHVTGWVEDIRSYYSKAKIFIAPMQIGTGLQNKLLEAMAMKIPSITSPLANSALKAKHNKEVLIGNSAMEYADNIIKILDDEKLAGTLSENGYAFVHNNYNWDSATRKLEVLMVNS